MLRMDGATSITLQGDLNRESTPQLNRYWTPNRTRSVPGQLGQYRLAEPLGRGGMGTVYRAEHVRLKKPVAVKVLDPRLVRDDRAVARFQREMEIVGGVEHSNLVRATDAGEADGVHFLVMELIDGVTFSGLLHARGPLPVPEACELVRQAALGLQGAHDHGLIHRDIKPSNLMLSAAGQVKVLDLGLARLRSAGPDELTRVGEVMGTAEYMAPEQWTQTHAVDIRADIYSLGCTLFALLTGEAPFPGSGPDSFLRLMCAHQQAPPPAITDRRPDAPPALCDLMLRMLAKNPDDRPATPGEVAAELAEMAAGADLTALTTAGAVTAPNVTPVRPHRRPAHRRRWILAAVMLAAVAGGVGASLLRGPFTAAASRTDKPESDAPERDIPLGPNKWHNLLTKPPEKRLWQPLDVSSVRLDADKEVLTIVTQRPSLLRLGDANSRWYKVQVGFRPVLWNGGCGVYFGGQFDAEKKFVCQRIDLQHVRHGPGLEYALLWSRYMVNPVNPAKPAITIPSSMGFGTEHVSSPAVGEQLIELEVRTQPVSLQIRWNGNECKKLVNDYTFAQAIKMFSGGDHFAGEFGIFCSATMTVTTARYFIIE
ncbi:serine/threonine-protein kinase [Gemmata sp. JC717]|uniref:serine/threonine-protein kinase n=1 Tax=Gemmata algarum TaxID=2975278 RepID=UPI0021BA96A6|nr:serine/threonine-protein kinase [Gemmata algarum]MDY3553307.1 serine/threonine-protein kinase [Gemmata algarum]